jgi:hypothetical protein
MINATTVSVDEPIRMRALSATPTYSYEFTKFLCKLHSGRATSIVLFGGSPTVAEAVDRTRNYGARIQKWLNTVYPPKRGKHVVTDRGVAATDTCFLAAAYHQLKPHWYAASHTPAADLAVLEYGVNDLMSSGGSGVLRRQLKNEALNRILDCTESVVLGCC